MAELLLVRSGNAGDPVTETFELELDGLQRFIGSRPLHYLGVDLPPIGETSRVSEFAGPDHVVVNVRAAETDGLGVDDPGYYVVEGLLPVDVTEAVA